jgi:hypothetical protein
MLRPGDQANFKTLSQAFANGDVALVDVQRISDGIAVAAICCVTFDGAAYQITPFATLVEGNPFELFRPPLPEGGYALDESIPE